MNIDEIRMMLPDDVRSYFDDIVNSRVLGANKQIGLIGKMIISIISDSSNIEDSKNRSKSIINYFKSTRGQNSRAIYNALCIYENKLNEITNITKGISMNLEQTAGAGDYKTVTQTYFVT